MTIDFYYFSGTGNTLLVVKKMTAIFQKNNIQVNLLKIEKSDPKKINQNYTIGLAFPVAFQSTFQFIWEFIKLLPNSNGTNIFMVDTMHFFSGGIIGPLKNLLEKKGYNPIGAKEIIMVNNVYRIIINEKITNKKINKGLKKAEKYALSIINNKSRWGTIPLFPYILYFLFSNRFFWKLISMFGKRFIVNKEKCTKCEICIKLCPVQNIKMNEYPVYLNKCQQCLRCVMHCPAEAIVMPIWKYKRYQVVDYKELI